MAQRAGPEFELQVEAELSDNDLRIAGRRYYELVVGHDIQTLLKNLNLRRVIGRYGESEEAAVSNIFIAARTGHRQEYPLSSFIVRDTSKTGAESIVGSASLQRGLPLFKHKSPVFSPLSRGFERTSEKLPVPKANAAAWSATMVENDEAMRHSVGGIYGLLRETEPSSWTLSPKSVNRSPSHPHAEGLRDAGYTSHHQFGWFDDLEGTMFRPVPTSVLFTAGLVEVEVEPEA